MTLKIFALSVSIVVSVLLVRSSLAADPGALKKNFSAEVETTTTRGTITAKFFQKNGKQRMEQNARGMITVNIARPDKKVVWMLMPDSKEYLEMPLDSKQDISSQLDDPGIKKDKKLLGNETLDGHHARKYHVTIISNGKKEDAGFIWEASDLNDFPVKYQNEDKTITTVWKNIKFGGVPDSLFVIPAGYKKIEVSRGGTNNPAVPGK